MARLLVGDKQFVEVDLGSFHEPEIQANISSRSHLIYPGFFFAPFEIRVESEHGTRMPDFILVELEYRGWWVCEVEMIDHDLFGHVIPQVRAFRDGHYKEAHVTHASKKNNKIDPVRFRVLIETESPKVLVVANRHKSEWESALQLERAKLNIFEIFRRNDLAEFIFKVNGFVPEPFGEILTTLEVDRGIRRILQVQTPSALPGYHGDILQIVINGVVSDWKIELYEDKAWLHPLGGHWLAGDSKYQLRKSGDGVLHIEKRGDKDAIQNRE